MLIKINAIALDSQVPIDRATRKSSSESPAKPIRLSEDLLGWLDISERGQYILPIALPMKWDERRILLKG